MMKGDNLTEQFSRRTPPDDGRQVGHQGLFRVAGQQTGEQDSAARSIAPSVAAQPSGDVFSHGSDYDVAEQQRPEHDEVAMRALQLPFEAEVGSSGARHHSQPAGRAIGGTGRKVRSMDHGVSVVNAHLRRESFKTLPISLLPLMGC
jgi:hypothetical protein